MTLKNKKIQLGVYKHYKGKLYKVLFLAKEGNNNAGLEDLVVYEQLEDSEDFKKGQIWVRNLSEFNDFVKINGKKVKRFKYFE